MKYSKRVESCDFSPVRKFYPYEVAAKQKGLKIRHLNIGQPDIETPRVFFNAVEQFADSVLAYAPTPGIEIYLKAVQTYYAGLGVELALGDIMTTYGGSEALDLILSCILDDGDEILIPEPFYPNYDTFVKINGAHIRPIPADPAKGYHFADRALIEPLINEHTRAILMTNPGNPTGAVLSQEEMRVMADIAREHGLFMVSDEVYREIIYSGEKPTTMLKLEDVAENVIVIDSVSKRFSATGARVGAIISRNKEFMSQLMKLCQGRLCTATLDQIGAAAMYEQLDAGYYADVLAEYTRRRDALVAALAKLPEITHNEPEGAFYVMAKLPVDDTEKLQYFLLEEFEDHGETVMFAPGEGFYATPGKGRDEIRIAYVTNPEDLTRAVELLGLGIQAYNARQGK